MVAPPEQLTLSGIRTEKEQQNPYFQVGCFVLYCSHQGKGDAAMYNHQLDRRMIGWTSNF